MHRYVHIACSANESMPITFEVMRHVLDCYAVTHDTIGYSPSSWRSVVNRLGMGGFLMNHGISALILPDQQHLNLLNNHQTSASTCSWQALQSLLPTISQLGESWSNHMSHGWNETTKTIEDQILFKASNARLPSLFGVVIYGLITGTLSNPPPC